MRRLPAFLRLPSPRRLLAVAATAWIVGRFFLTPSVIRGESMEPTYGRRGVNVLVRCAFLFREPRRGEVVVLRFHGRTSLLKRVLAFPGETVEFREGACFVDGRRLDEPWVVLPCDWDLPPRVVEPGKLYVMGDNRSMPAEAHVGGEIDRSRLLGKPLW